jgi:CRP-like cAMP-binding protein
LSTTSAVYDTGDYIDVYAINPSNSEGVRVIHYPKGDVPTSKPAENQTLAEVENPFTGATIGLYLLSSGELQINTQEADGKDYIFRWSYL